jgi:hypothetical protein
MWRVGVNDLEEFIAEAYRKTAEKLDAGEIPDATEMGQDSRG